MPRTIEIDHPDDDPREMVLAEDWIAQGICRRLGFQYVVLHPTEEDTFIYNPRNWWDGPTHVRWDPDLGHFFADGWGGPFHWPLIGPLK